MLIALEEDKELSYLNWASREDLKKSRKLASDQKLEQLRIRDLRYLKLFTSTKRFRKFVLKKENTPRFDTSETTHTEYEKPKDISSDSLPIFWV